MKLEIAIDMKPHLPKLDGERCSFFVQFQTVKHLIQRRFDLNISQNHIESNSNELGIDFPSKINTKRDQIEKHGVG